MMSSSNGSGGGSAGDNNSAKTSKRSFEFRMSKKVAELTQVVHMLFTRNHEKEVEIEALKEAYEFEIADLISDARQRISALGAQLEDSLRQKAGDTDRVCRLLESEFQSREEALKAKLEDSEKQLQEERSECQNLRDMLIRAQRDIENLRQGVSQHQSSLQEEVAKREREIERLKKLVAQLEQALKECGKESTDLIKELEKSHDALERELRQVHSALEESHRTRDQLIVRNKQLEGDIKNLKRDFSRKVAEVVNSQRYSKNGSTLSQDQNEELERLRREIHRYRLELSNREGNFNRMFTEKQPVLVDRSGSTGALKLVASQSAGSQHHTMNGNNNASVKREKTVSQLQQSGPVISFEEQSPQFADRQRSMSSPKDGHDSRLPSICSTPDLKVVRATPNSAKGGLSKPKPLPKEMLFTK